MKNFHSKLKEALKRKGLSQKALVQNIGMTESGFLQMISKNSIKVETLEKICTELNVPFAYFLEEGEAQIEIKDESFWERMVDDLMAEVKSLKIQVYRTESILKKNGIANFSHVSEQGGVLVAA